MTLLDTPWPARSKQDASRALAKGGRGASSLVTAHEAKRRLTCDETRCVTARRSWRPAPGCSSWGPRRSASRCRAPPRARPRPPGGDHPDRTRGRDLSTRTSRSITTSAPTPTRTNPAGEPQFHALAGTPAVNGLSNGLLDDNPNEDNPQTARPRRSADLRPEPQLHARAGSVRRRSDERVRPEDDGRRLLAEPAPDSVSYGPKGIVMDYYDGNTVTGAVELRAALLPQRQLLRRPVRALLAGRDQPRQRRHRRRRSPRRLELAGRQRRAAGRRRTVLRPVQQRRRSARGRRPADGRDGLAERQEHRQPAERKGRHLGLVPGWLRPVGRGKRGPRKTRRCAARPTRTSAARP